MISSDDFDTDEAALNALVDGFAAKMKEKLHAKRREGWVGWDEPHNGGLIRQRLEYNIREGDWIGAGALAVMLWNLKEEPCEPRS